VEVCGCTVIGDMDTRGKGWNVCAYSHVFWSDKYLEHFRYALDSLSGLLVYARLTIDMFCDCRREKEKSTWKMCSTRVNMVTMDYPGDHKWGTAYFREALAEWRHVTEKRGLAEYLGFLNECRELEIGFKT